MRLDDFDFFLRHERIGRVDDDVLIAAEAGNDLYFIAVVTADSDRLQVDMLSIGDRGDPQAFCRPDR